MIQIIKYSLLIIHITLGSLAVIVGLITLVSRKPVFCSRLNASWHLTAGFYYTWLMAGVIGSAIVLTLISLDPYFAGLTAAAAIGVFSGKRVLKRKRPDLRKSDRAKLIDWIVTILILLIGFLLIYLVHTGGLKENIPVVLALGYGSAVYAGYDIYRFCYPVAFPFHPDLWLYEHIVKMIGGYFGAVAAFSGIVLVFLDPPWRQLWATLLGQFLSITLVLYYIIRKARNAKKKGVNIEMESRSNNKIDLLHPD